MLGLGSSLFTESVVGGLSALGIVGITIFDIDDENVAVYILATDATTVAALYNGITPGIGNKVNGTATLTVTNTTADPDKVGTDTFNIFQFQDGNQNLFFLSLATSDITISVAQDFLAVDLTAATFLDSGGSDAELDASGSGEEYNFSLVVNIDGFIESNTATQTGISIDAN